MSAELPQHAQPILPLTVTQNEGGICQSGFSANLGLFPDSKIKSVLGQQVPDERESRLILWRFSVAVFFDFDDFLMVAPGNQNIRRVAMPSPFVMVFEAKRLFLPRIRTTGGNQDLICL